VEKYRQERHMTVRGNKILKPLRKIEEAGFPGMGEINTSVLSMVCLFKSLFSGSYPR